MLYKCEYTREISFPLGGIGTGCIGLSGDGRLVDWEIFNRPSKGSINDYSHFAIRAIKDGKITAAVLNGDMIKDYTGQYNESYGTGPNNHRMCGFTHFKNTEFIGEFPIASVSFNDEKFPANVKMTAFNPFIPHDSQNSSIPAAFFEFEVENTENCEFKYQIAFSVANPFKKSLNSYDNKNGVHFITMKTGDGESDDVNYGDLTVATDCENTFCQTYWYRGFWRDGIVNFWNEFSTQIKLKERIYDTEGEKDTCTLLADIDVLPGEKKKVRFVLSWNVPNYYNYWCETEDEEIRKPWKNYYATVFNSSADSAIYSLENFDTLFERTKKFKNTLHNSSLPAEIIDAASSNLSVLKSPTVLRLEDGSFYGWEGVFQDKGSCEGTCQHVWNYAYAMCFLFPDLERSIRDMEFNYSTDEDGRMGFRIMLPLGRKMTDFRACVDGQMGAVLKTYREWKISGDDQWLREKWEKVKKVLEYAWSPQNPDKWDADKDGILEGRQHHTLDMEMFGPSSWLEGMYLAALKAASEMAKYLHDDDKAEEYIRLFKQGYAYTKKELFNGKYFVQKVDITDKKITDSYEGAQKYWNDEVKQIKYQIAQGCAIDQLLAQWHSDILGLGNIFDKSQTDTALAEMLKNNFIPAMRDFSNPWRVFSINDESGTIICSYPENVEKPIIPIPYCEETMTGFEYAFAGLLCSQGKISEGIKVVKAIRDRFDGKKRNPWNEFECGCNYARSMASYALLPILSGFEFDMPHSYIGFNPYKRENYSCIWSLQNAWGNFEVCGNRVIFSVFEKSIKLKAFGIKFANQVKKVIIDGSEVEFTFKNGVLYFEETTIFKSLEITI